MILFIDDEKRYVKNYIEEIEALGFEINYIKDVDFALEFIKSEEGKKIEAIVLDVMMPSGKTFTNEQTEEGLNTGIVFFKTLKKILPNIMVFILTNVPRREVSDFFENQNNCIFVRKDDEDLKSTAFAKLLNETLKNNYGKSV